MIVTRYFIDKTDKSEYYPGDIYPREGLEANNARIADLTAKGYISDEPDEEQKPAKKTASNKKRKGVRP